MAIGLPLRWVIFDLDGCLSDDSRRQSEMPVCGSENNGNTHHSEWDAYHSDMINDPVLSPGYEVFQYYNQRFDEYRIAFCTARPAKYREASVAWIEKNLQPRGNWSIYMRDADDLRPSPELKIDQARRVIQSARGTYLHQAFDDRPDVIEAYRSNMIPAQILAAGVTDHESGQQHLLLKGAVVMNEAVSMRTLPTGNVGMTGAPTKRVVPTAPDLLDVMADTFRERNAVYKDNWITCGEVMRILFPDGVKITTQAEQEMFGIVYQIVGKLTRFAGSGCTHQDSIHDLAVYSAIAEHLLLKNENVQIGAK